MIDFSDPESVCRALDYFIEFLGKIAPLIILGALALWVFKK